jgi:hypothetical protein
MNSLIRFLLFLVLLVLLGVGIRLMYYGLQSLVGSSAVSGVFQVLALLAGVVCFIAGIFTGVVLLSPSRV